MVNYLSDPEVFMSVAEEVMKEITDIFIENFSSLAPDATYEAMQTAALVTAVSVISVAELLVFSALAGLLIPALINTAKAAEVKDINLPKATSEEIINRNIANEAPVV